MKNSQIIIQKEEENLRIDKLLSLKYPEKSRAYFQYLIENGHVLLNNSPIKKRIKTKQNDTVQISFIPYPELSLKPQKIALDILYEDPDIIIINKKPDMVVHPAPGNPDNTFANALLYHCGNLPMEENNLRPGIVHRLDKETSGVLIAAKNENAHRNLVKQFSSRNIKKTYLAICSGRPKNQMIFQPIGRNKIKRKEMQITSTGKEAATEIITLASHENISLVKACPQTGRTHQIRVHLKHINHPIIGDKIYGNTQSKAPRHMLHAYSIKLNHPIFLKSSGFRRLNGIFSPPAGRF